MQSIIPEEAARSIAGNEPQVKKTVDQQSISFGFSLQIRTSEGFGIKGDVSMSKTAIPARAHAKPAAPVSVDVDDQYDDKLDMTPHSALKYRPLQPQPTTRTTGPIQAAPVATNRVTGSTRFLLWVVLILCIAFLINGVVWPAVKDTLTQLKYGDSRIATYDIKGKHWITEETNGRLHIIDSNPDGSHSQQLTTSIANAPAHGLVTLKENGQHVDVYINDAFLTYLVADRNDGYKWEAN